MANVLKGKTLTTLTVILPNEEVAAEMMKNIHSHLEFMQQKSYRDGPLKLIQYFITSSHLALNGKKAPHFSMEKCLRKLGE